MPSVPGLYQSTYLPSTTVEWPYRLKFSERDCCTQTLWFVIISPWLPGDSLQYLKKIFLWPNLHWRRDLKQFISRSFNLRCFLLIISTILWWHLLPFTTNFALARLPNDATPPIFDTYFLNIINKYSWNILLVDPNCNPEWPFLALPLHRYHYLHTPTP